MDETDYANDLVMREANDAINEHRRKAALIPKGNPGECAYCGEWSGRLVNGVCAPCRERYKMK